MLIQNVGNYLPLYVAERPRRLETLHGYHSWILIRLCINKDNVGKNVFGNTVYLELWRVFIEILSTCLAVWMIFIHFMYVVKFQLGCHLKYLLHARTCGWRYVCTIKFHRMNPVFPLTTKLYEEISCYRHFLSLQLHSRHVYPLEKISGMWQYIWRSV
jgi:hypothetical protein